jgi:hypothetical protein
MTIPTHQFRAWGWPDWGLGVVVPRMAEVAIVASISRIGCVMPKIIEPKVPAVECAVCGQQMKHLANLKSTAGFEASRVYRCYSCDHVLQREW